MGAGENGRVEEVSVERPGPRRKIKIFKPLGGCLYPVGRSDDGMIRSLITWSLVAGMLFAARAPAATILLKDGRALQGKVVKVGGVAEDPTNPKITVTRTAATAKNDA